MDRVLEIGGYAAAYAGRLFVSAGADVVRADVGATAPAWASDAAMEACLHPGKRRVALAASQDQLTLLAELAARADVVICHADSADAVAALGFADWRAGVKVAVTPFGLTGPKRNWRATPSTLLAMGGYTALMGDADRAPLSLPGHYLEFQSGALAFTAANAARFAGADKVVDLSMLETLMTCSQFTTVRWHCAGELRSRHGSDFWFVVPSELFRCADGWAYVNIVPQFWDAFAVFLQRPELLLDPRFENNDLRMANRAALHAVISEALAVLPVAEVGRRALACRVPVGVVQTLEEVLEDPHLRARDFWQPGGGEGGEMLRVAGLPFRIEYT